LFSVRRKNPTFRKAFLPVLFILCFGYFHKISSAQQAVVQGFVSDSATAELLPGVNIRIDKNSGTVTDVKGEFFIEVKPGSYQFEFSYVGYQTTVLPVQVSEGQNITLEIRLKSKSVELDMAVVTAGKFSQELSATTVSVSVMKPAFIDNINTIDMSQTINYLAGVDVLDGQPSIRGGGGYSYGAGSRVSVLVDGLPVLSPAENDVKWNFIPVEDIAQVEVLKGASSALYGSSALNGVINFRTAWPGTEPKTIMTLYGGFYTKPSRDEMSWWWDTYPAFTGASFSHAQKFGTVDLLLGANGSLNQGYRTDNFNEQVRANLKFRHRPKKIKGLMYGLNANMQWQKRSDFFLWQDADSGAFIQDPDVVNANKGYRFTADPWLAYQDKRNNKHSLKTRYYGVTNEFREKPENNNSSEFLFGEYQYQRLFKELVTVTAGLAGNFAKAEANLYGDHQSTNFSAYTQLDSKFFKRLSASLGLRWEYQQMDEEKAESAAVVRAGLNYQAAKATFIRASFGQGYRFPSIAEKYTATSIGVLNIFPNPDLQSETSWSTEVGLRQGFTISKWTGFFDLAFFWTEYSNMIEFTFGVYKPDTVEIPTLDHVGFKSLNVGKARISGLEIDLTGNGSIGKVPLTLFLGYTYMNPVDLSNDSVQDQILKYRYRHSFKGDFEVNLKRFSTGLTIVYSSFMERIDPAFEEKILGQEIFPGLKEYRENNNSGSVVFDVRLAYQFVPSTRVALLFKNIFNAEYMGRPGDIQPPRNITIQFLMRF